MFAQHLGDPNAALVGDDAHPEEEPEGQQQKPKADHDPGEDGAWGAATAIATAPRWSQYRRVRECRTRRSGSWGRSTISEVPGASHDTALSAEVFIQPNRLPWGRANRSHGRMRSDHTLPLRHRRATDAKR
jgi:hypothetical protein